MKIDFDALLEEFDITCAGKTHCEHCDPAKCFKDFLKAKQEEGKLNG